jgi:hypothetical protein
MNRSRHTSDVDRPRRVLAVMLEFDGWRLGHTWSYLSSYALLDGFDACRVECVVLPALLCDGDPLKNPWVEACETLLAGERFDQAWVWITHSHYTADFWRWLATVAPVRVGVLMESLRYTPAEIAAFPPLGQRFDAVIAQLRHMTHVLTYDEQDVVEIASATGLPTRLYHSMIPVGMVRSLPAPHGEKAVFLGSLYGPRQAFLEAAGLGDRLQLLVPPEAGTELERRFDAVNAEFLGELAAGGSSGARMQEYAGLLRAVRREVLEAVFDAYRSGLAVLNLPPLFKGFPGRVVEGMAAGVPVVSSRLDRRPTLEAVFTHGRELITYDPADPADLAVQLDRLAADPALQRALVVNARARLLELMTCEAQMPELLDWISRTTRRPRLLDRIRLPWRRRASPAA